MAQRERLFKEHPNMTCMCREDIRAVLQLKKKKCGPPVRSELRRAPADEGLLSVDHQIPSVECQLPSVNQFLLPTMIGRPQRNKNKKYCVPKDSPGGDTIGGVQIAEGRGRGCTGP